MDTAHDVPRNRSLPEIGSGVPSTYVPARNTVFLGIAASYAEAHGARAIFIGAHREDASGYPDCRREYLDAFREVIRLGTKAGGDGRLELVFPLIDKNKKLIIEHGKGLLFRPDWKKVFEPESVREQVRAIVGGTAPAREDRAR